MFSKKLTCLLWALSLLGGGCLSKPEPWQPGDGGAPADTRTSDHAIETEVVTPPEDQFEIDDDAGAELVVPPGDIEEMEGLIPPADIVEVADLLAEIADLSPEAADALPEVADVLPEVADILAEVDAEDLAAEAEVCEPETCESLGWNCGEPEDGCGGILDCDVCTGEQDACLLGICVCQVDCDGKACGDDGCGGDCGECEPLSVCSTEGLCECEFALCNGKCCDDEEVCFDEECCVVDCVDKACGDDGCGGSCGECTGEQEACDGGICICQPDCTGKDCGDDGCGGSCGNCLDDGNSCTDDLCENGLCGHPVLANVECEDELACTMETACLADGTCGGGSPVTGADCADDVGETGQCEEPACVEPTGCTKQPLVDGTLCELDNAAAACLAGICEVADCEEGFAHCNDSHEDGCEVALLSDPSNCGECGELCAPDNAAGTCTGGECLLGDCEEGFGNCDSVDGNGCEADLTADPENCSLCGQVCTTTNPAKVGTCVASQCSFAACAPGTWNMDGLPGNGCECSEGPEICNNEDDNCDGQVDEGFDLAADPANCGECGQACAPPDAVEWACVGGVCVVLACPDGFMDKDGEWTNGCEEPLFYVAEIWVDSINGGGADEDGSSEKPYDSLAEAVQFSSPSTLIHIRTGTYGGGIEVDKAGLSLVAEEGADVTVTVAAGGKGFHITADEVTIAGVKITGGRFGVHFDGPEPDRLLVGTVFDVEVIGLEGLDDEGQTSAAVLVQYADHVTVSAVTAEFIEGGTGKDNGQSAGQLGGTAAGIVFAYADDAVAAANDLSVILGGDGGPMAQKSKTGSGGRGVGIILEHADNAWLAGNFLSEIWGGDGGTGGYSMTSCDTGGPSVGIDFDSSTGALAKGNVIVGLLGGQGGDCPQGFNGKDQEAFGIYLDNDSVANTIAMSNTLDGDPIVYLHGVDDVVVEGLVLVEDVNPTNWGKLAVLESSNVQIKNNELAWFRGRAGLAGFSGWNGQDGFSAVGIRLVQCTNCTVAGNVVTDIVGGQGGNGGYHGAGAPGGAGIGVLVSESSGCTVRGNYVRSVTGGHVGYNGYAYANYTTPEPGGEGLGYSLDEVQSIDFSHNVAAAILGGGSYVCELAARCVLVDASDSVKVKHLTCYDTGMIEDCAAGYGVEVGPLQEAPVQVLDSIISAVDDHCLYSEASGPGVLSAHFTDLHSCGGGMTDNATLGSGCIEVDPEFEDAEGGDYHLEETSLCIDAGNDAGSCAEEPPPNGCRVNLGAYGNTPDATSTLGADHCDVCPQ